MKPSTRGTKRKGQSVATPPASGSCKKQASSSLSRSKPGIPLYLQNLTAVQRKKYDELALRGVQPNRYADKTALARIGLLDDVTRLLRGIGWEQLLDFNVDTYEELVYEFLCTFEFKEGDEAKVIEPAMHFRLMGKQHVLTGMQLENIFGWKRFVQQELPEFAAKDFWSNLTKDSDVYSGRSSKSSKIFNPSYRYIYKLFAYTLFGRENIGPVSNLELAILYCVDHGIKVGFVTILGRRFKEVIAQKEGPIYVGCFVTMIATHLKILDDVSRKLTKHPNKLLDLPSLVAMRFLRRSGEHYEIISHEQVPTSVLTVPVAAAHEKVPLPEADATDSLRNRVDKLKTSFQELKADIGIVRTELAGQRNLLNKMFDYMKFHFPRPPPR